MFSKPRLDTLSDGIFGVAMTLLILDVRLPDDFHPEDTAKCCRALPSVAEIPALCREFRRARPALACRISRLRSRAEFVDREYANWWLLYLLLITCVPFTTIVVGRFAHFAPAIWLYAGHTLLIALVGMRLFFITPHMEQGDHLRHRQLSAMLLVVSSLLALAMSFVNSRMALWCLTLNFAAPLLKKWSHRAAVSG